MGRVLTDWVVAGVCDNFWQPDERDRFVACCGVVGELVKYPGEAVCDDDDVVADPEASVAAAGDCSGP